MTQDDESRYSPNWRSSLYALRLIGRLHELRAQDPKPPVGGHEGENDTISSSTGPGMGRRHIIIRRRRDNHV